VVSYLQHLIRGRGMMLDDENLDTNFCGTNLPSNAVGCCYHPPRTDDGTTASVSSIKPQCHLKFKYVLSLNRNALIDSIYLKFSPNQWLKLYRIFRKYLKEKTPIDAIDLVYILCQRASDYQSLCSNWSRLVNWKEMRRLNWTV